jgi:ketosteroid isomerase-like protein
MTMLTNFKGAGTDAETAAPAQARPDSSRRTLRRLEAAVAVLGAALLAMTLVLVWPSGTSTAEALHDDLTVAWSTGDADAIRALYTEDAVLWMSQQSEPVAVGIDEIVAEAASAASVGFRAERIGPVTQVGDMVTVVSHMSSNDDVAGEDAIQVFRLEDGKVAEDWVIWSG